VTEDYQLGDRVLRDLPRKKGDTSRSYLNYPGFAGKKDVELVVGSVFGVRGWDRDKYGRLVPVSVDAGPFKPGVNTGTCFGARIRDHNMFDCACGYYAYFSDNTAAAVHGEIGGIIEGTGITVVGSEGFRAEKAELKALVVRPHDIAIYQWKNRKISAPDSADVGVRAPLRWVAKWFLPRIDNIIKHKRWDRSNNLQVHVPVTYAALAAPLAIATIISTLYASAFFIFGLIPVALLATLSFATVRVGEALYFPNQTESKNTFHAFLRGGANEPKIFKKKFSAETVDEGDPEDPKSIARLRVLYPDVPIFFSLEEATREFPLSKASEFKRPDPPLPSPLNTDNFWSLK